MIINGVEIMLNVLKDWPNSIHFGLETGRWFNWIGLTLPSKISWRSNFCPKHKMKRYWYLGGDNGKIRSKHDFGGGTRNHSLGNKNVFFWLYGTTFAIEWMISSKIKSIDVFHSKCTYMSEPQGNLLQIKHLFIYYGWKIHEIKMNRQEEKKKKYREKSREYV